MSDCVIQNGRAGNGGISISFCGKDEEPYWKDILKLIKVNVKTMKDHPFPWKDEEPNPEAKPDLRNKKNFQAAKNPVNDDSFYLLLLIFSGLVFLGLVLLGLVFYFGFQAFYVPLLIVGLLAFILASWIIWTLIMRLFFIIIGGGS